MIHRNRSLPLAGLKIACSVSNVFENNIYEVKINMYPVLDQGRIQGRGRPGGQDPPFGGPPTFIKREKALRVCARKRRILVLNSYPDPLSEILYPPL